MPTAEELINQLSPEALDLFKKQLPMRLKEMGELERNTALERLSKIPGLLEAEAPTLAPWQRGLQTIGAPFQWLHERVMLPFAATVTSPFTPSVGAPRPDESWLERERREYEQWEEPMVRMPWGGEFRPTKGLVETLPWLAMPTAAGVAGRLSVLAGRAGMVGRAAAVGARAMKPVVAVERVVTLAKPMEMLGKRLAAKTLPETARFTALSNDQYAKFITRQDWQRSIAQTFGRKPFFKGVIEAIGGKAATVTQAIEERGLLAPILAANVRKDLLSKGQVALSNLRAINLDPIRLFGVDEATGLARGIRGRMKGLSKHIDDIAEHPSDYILTPQQKAYIREVHNIEDWVLDGLREAGVDVRLLKFDEFSHWVHRVVLGKRVDGKFVELKRGFGRIGSKQSWEKTRFYETAAEGLEQGVIYSPNLERSVDLYIQSAAKRISDQRIAEMGAVFGKTAKERMPAGIRRAREDVVAKRLALRQMSSIIERLETGKDFAPQTWRGIKKWYPEEYTQLRALAKEGKKAPQSLKKAVVTEQDALKEVAKEVRPKYKVALERAGQPSLGTEATIWHPAFQGKIYPKEFADAIQGYWADSGFGALQKAATISGAMRTLVAAADFSAPWIQGVTGMALHPKAWGSSVKLMFNAFKNPKTYQEFLIKNADDALEFANFGGYLGGFEYVEAMPTLQKVARFAGAMAGKPRMGEAAVRQTYGRFEAAFGAFGDSYRVNMWKALKGRAKNTDELMEITRHIDRMSGVMSTKGLGIGRTQRDFEAGFLFFAPRYTRAGFALVGDVFKGGLTGAEARKALGSMMAAGAAFYAGTCAALGQEPNFDPSTGRFMTIEIKDPLTGTTRHFGIGGMMTSLARFGADVTASALSIGQNEPQDFVKLSRVDNPFMRFMFSKSAPLTGFMTGMIEGKNYFGEPFENAGDYAMFMGEQVTPIAMQAALMEEGGLAPTAILAEEAGMRTFPLSDWEKRDEVRDRVAQERFGMDWEEAGTRLGKLSQLELERDYPELREATELAAETSTKMARGEGKVWNEWKLDGQAIEDRYKTAVNMAAQEFEQIRDGTTFRQKVDEASAIRRAMYASRERNPAYTEIQDYFNEPLEPDIIAKMNPNDLARREYYQMMYSPDMYDQFDNYRFDEADRREALFVQKYGDATLDYVERYMGAKWEEPMAMKVLREARATLKPYWDIERRIWANYSPELKQISDQLKILERTDPMRAKQILFSHLDIMMARRMILLYRKQLKMQNPEMANALNLFYRY